MKNVIKRGTPPYSLAILHGGPGAPCSAAPIAMRLSERFGVIEPIQTADSVEGQIVELKKQLDKNAIMPVTLVGWSWGAWLGFMFASRYPENVNKLLLVGSGPFEQKYARHISKTRLSRLTKEEQKEAKACLEKLSKGENDESLLRLGQLFSKADSYDRVATYEEPTMLQVNIYKKVWSEAEELRRNGALLRMGRAIKCPVVALHGEYDTHPHEGVSKPLSKIISDFRMIVVDKCGHEPWAERQARERFFEMLINEL